MDEAPRTAAAREAVVLVTWPDISEQSIEQMLGRATASVIDVVGGRAPADLANPEVLDGVPARGEPIRETPTA